MNPSDEGINPYVDLETLPCVHLDETLLEMDDTQESNQTEYDEYEFKKKENEMKAKKILVTMKMEEKKQKNVDDNNCIKEGINRVIKLIENWAEESSISGVIDIDGNTRREDYEDVEEWMHNPRAIGKFTKRTQTFFTMQT